MKTRFGFYPADRVGEGLIESIARTKQLELSAEVFAQPLPLLRKKNEISKCKWTEEGGKG